MKSIHVLRKPCSRSAPTVAANVLRYGTGALNIGATRIKHVLVAGGSLDLNPHLRQGIKRGQSLNPTAFALGDNATVPVNPAGRWPANLILQHLDGCVQDGVKKVKPGNGSGRTGAGANGFRTAYVGGDRKGAGFTGSFVDDDGTETVTAWVCVEGCPVAALDAQSGFLVARGNKTSMGHGPGSGSGVTGWGKGRADAPPRPDLNDGGGGASRFFKQVGGRSE